jgi:hypothetical protein
MRGRVAYYYGGLARTLELEREPSSLRCCVAAGCGVDERWVMSDHSASTTSLLAVCCRLLAAAGRTLYPRSGLGDSNSMRKPLCPQYTHAHTHTNKREAEPKWRTHGISSDASTSGDLSLAGHHQIASRLPLHTKVLAPLYSLFCVLQMPE